MKIAIFAAFVLLFSTVICIDLSNQPLKIQSLVKKLFNLKPDPYIAHNLAEPVNVAIVEEPVEVTSKEINDVNYKFKNVTIYRNSDRSKNLSNRYTSLVCDFNQQLAISRWIDPPNLEIRGIYDVEETAKPIKPTQSFTVSQIDGRLTYKNDSTQSSDVELVYSDQELKFGESNKNHITVLRAIGRIVDEVINKTVKEVNQKNNLIEKMDDFKQVFPFLSNCLDPIDKTALRSQDENTYSINNTESEQWENTTWILPYVLIRGLNNFKQVTIKATKEHTNGIRFNMTLITKRLAGLFEWKYGKVGQAMTSNLTKNFTITNLTLTANMRFEKDWFVDKVDVDLGLIEIQKSKQSELLPDINDFAYAIFHENLDRLIKTHLKQLIHEEYSQTTSTVASTTKMINVSTTSAFNRTMTNTSTTIKKRQATNSTTCIDDRRWWQKLYKRNKCKDRKSSAQTKPDTNECVDTRWWIQKLFIRNKCTKPQEVKLN